MYGVAVPYTLLTRSPNMQSGKFVLMLMALLFCIVLCVSFYSKRRCVLTWQSTQKCTARKGEWHNKDGYGL